MDKNKNRTDLLAAGRKKLQQFRQKKDSKGSKSSGKASKFDHDVVADEAPSVTKPVKGNKEHRDVDGPGQGSATELVDSSSRGSAENIVASIANVGTLDPSSTSNLSGEDSGVGEDGSRLRLINDYYVDAAVPDEDVQSSNLDNGMLPVSSLEKLNVEVKHESGHAPVMPVGLKAVLDYANARKVRESMPARGEDQVPDVGAIQEGTYSGLEPSSTSSLTDFDGNTNNAFPGLDEIAQINLEDAQEVAKMEYTSRETAQSSEHDNFPAFAGTADDQDAMKPNTHSLPISDGFPTSTPELIIHPKEDAIPGVHGREDMKLLNASGDSEFVSMGSHMVSGEEVTPVVSLTQLAKLLQLLGEDEFRFLVCQRESLSGICLKNDPGFNLSMCSSSEFSERLKEHLYVATLEKEMMYLQLCEQWGVEKEFDYHRLQGDHDKSAVSASFDDVRGKKKYLSDELARCRSELDSVANEREELQKHITSSKIELNRFSSRIDELQTELARSEHQLSRVSAELVDCTGLLADLHVRNEDLKASVASVTEEKNKLEQENRDGAVKNEKLATELKECNALLELSQVENVNSRGSLALIAEEKAKLEEEQQNYVLENNKLLAELSEWKNSVEALQVENANLNRILTSEREDRSKLEEAKECLVQENEKLSTELLEFQHLVETHREEIDNLNGSLDLVMKERNTLGEEMDHLKLKEEKHLTELTNCKNSMMDLQVKYERAMDDLKDSALHLERLSEENATLTGTLESYEAKMREFDVHTMKSEKSASEERILLEDSSEFLDWKRHLRGMEKIIQVLGKAIEGTHFHSASLSRSGKAAGAGVSKLIQAFEPKQTDDESEETGIRGGADAYMLALEQISNLKALYKDLVLDAEHACELYKGEQSNKHLLDTKLRELVLHVEALNGHCNYLEETFIKHVVLDEALRQYMSTIEGKKGEIVVLCEDMRREETVTKSKNYELTRKLCTFESRISKLQVQVDELQQQSDYMATLEHQLEILHRKLDASIVTVSSTLSSEAGDSQDVGTRVATSVDAAIAVIQDLQGKLEDAHRNYNLLSSSYEDVTGKTKDLEGKSELTANLLHKIYDNLQKLVNDSHPYMEESQNNFGREELVDPFDISKYDIFVEQLGKLIVERRQLESMNKKQMSELLEREKDIKELSKRCISSDLIVKLLGDIESVVNVDGIEIEPSELVSSVESITHLLIEKYRSTQEQVGLFRETLKSKEIELIQLRSQFDHLSFSFVPYENENHIFKESLRSAMDQLVTFQSQIQLKETELQQSEQRVSALREKLHIAVTKGKGLISQRDSLKQSLSATSSELEKCLHELQLKDATLQEIEIKLKTYSEAGERMEALESELSYIRNSATALRESFLLKDSVLQRIEEILEDLELPEHFHAKDIIEKIDWLAKSVSGNTFPVNSWDQKSSTEAGSYPESGFGATEGWKEDLQPVSMPADELRRNYEELQSKFYGLAEQSEMLEQSLMERNNLVQRWEELLDKINMPPQLRSLEPEDRIEWLQGALSEANGCCDSLQQNIYNLENVRESLTGDLEDSQRRLSDLEAALKSVTNEREQLAARLEVLSRDYDKVYREADDRCNSLQQNIYNLENVCGSLTANLEDSKRRLADLEAALESATNEREQLSASLEVLHTDYDKISEKAASYEIENDKLLNEVDKLQLKLDEKRVDEEHMHHVHCEIRRLQDLIKDTVEDSETEDPNSGISDILCLERLLRKLVDKYREHSSVQHVAGLVVEEHIPEDSSWTHGEGRPRQAGNCEELDAASLEKKLEDAEGDLMRMKEEKDKHAERNQSLEHEVKELEVKNQELQKLLIEEEQKSASVKEKLNVAVRKGKTLVQKQDSMRQSINDLTSEVERLNSDIRTRENLLSEYEQKIKDLSTSQKKLEEMESEIRFLRNQFAEADGELQDQRHTLSMILGALADIDLGVELRIVDPIEKLKQIGKVWRDLHSAISSSEQDSRKSKRAAELLLAELNEVQERNEDLQEELSKAKMEISELSKERDLAEAANCESLAHLEQLSALHSEGRNSQVSELTALKSGLEQLRPGFMEINTLLSDILPKDLELLYNLGASMKSLLESRDTSNVGGQTLIGASSGILSKSENKVNFLHSESFLDGKMREQFGEDYIIDLWRSVRSNFQDLATEIVAFDEKLHRHSKSLHEEVILLSEIVETLHRELTSHKYSLESAKEEISQLETTCKQKEIDNLTMRGYATMLYEACKNSILEIENCKGQTVARDAGAGDPRYNVKSIDGRDIFSGKTLPRSEEYITSMVNRLLSLIKDLHSIQAESVEVSQREMKATISSLQKELRDKDTEKDKICVELISQIKQAEATAMSKLQELENAKAHIEFLRAQLEEVQEQRNVLEQTVKELQGQETNLIGLQERVKSLTDALTSKEQETEALLQALDEEEAQMEDMTNKMAELEKVLQQKDIDLENAEASRGKALKKLSVTVSKFDELHHLSATLLSEVEKLQSQVQERDSEISFLRDEITRCTSDSLHASKNDERSLDEIRDIMTWLDSMISGVQKHDVHLDDKKIYQAHEYKEMLQKQITSIFSELESLREAAQSKDNLLHIERSRVEDLTRKGELLENSLRERDSQLSMHQNVADSSKATNMTSEIVEVEPVVNKWTVQGTSIAPQVRSLRKVTNEQVAIAINDMDVNNRDRLEDEDDDKAHGFKSLTTSKIVPRFTRPVTDLIDGLWVSCDRALMRQPALRLGVILYWAVIHALLAIFVV